MVEQLTRVASQKTLRVKTKDYEVLANLVAETESDDHLGEKEGLNLFAFVQNDGVDKYDGLGLYETVPGTCILEKKLGKGMCRYNCTCPSGFSMWPNSSVDISPCSRGASRNCYRLSCWDYAAGACAVIVVGVIIVGTGGSATTVLVFACAAP